MCSGGGIKLRIEIDSMAAKSWHRYLLQQVDP
jgi:hypothetical protein